MSTFTNKNNDRHKYCPEYDTFLSKMRQELKERLIKHSNLREPWIKKAVDKVQIRYDLFFPYFHALAPL